MSCLTNWIGQKKLDNLTAMRMDAEISKEEYQNFRQIVTAEITEIEKSLLLLESPVQEEATDKMSLDQLKELLAQKIDFTQPKLDRQFLEQLVCKIIPRSADDFEWYLNLLPRQNKPIENFIEVCTLNIDFDEAKEYRKSRKGMLRRNQWRDIAIHIYI